jgi:hypothetical protein
LDIDVKELIISNKENINGDRKGIT